MKVTRINRRVFGQQTLGVAAAAALSSWSVPAEAAWDGETKRMRVGVIGCGSVSNVYLPHLAASPYVALISACDIKPERAKRQAGRFHIPHHYPHIDDMLAGAAFDLLVNLTDMQEHEHLNRQAIAAGKHIWSEKPIANSLQAGQALLEQAKKRGVRVWGAPTVVNSPQFACMARILNSGALGRVAAAHADYGHTGPDWSSFFYEKGGGSMPDLGVYNLTTLTGLLGAARSVVALTSVVTPTRNIRGKGRIRVSEEDNAMLLLDHGKGTLAHVQCSFNFFNPHGHEGSKEKRHTISIVGSTGVLGLVGYDWEPLGVDVATVAAADFKRQATDKGGYVWQQGASQVAECLVKGQEPLFTAEHALHVVEIICAARQSQETGQRIDLKSTFKWPVVS
jgi:predicted dehydrogenase